ncbi:MAG: SPOR domain-containing protein [Treponema sp.]|jgi:cell division septation protein DedD|nr:SPOR domain-containing protein [Treponema sp.]
MEKKKIILISVIIGLFLFIAIALPLSLLSSKDTVLAGTSPAVSAVPKPEEPYLDRPASMDVRDTIVNPPVNPPDSNMTDGNPIDGNPPDGSSSAQNIIINNYDTAGTRIAESKTVPAESGGLTLTIVPAAPVTQEAPVTVRTPPPVSSPAPKAQQSAPSGGKSQTTQPKQTAAKPATTTAKPPVSSVSYNYWIQTGAFSTKAHAESVQKALKEQGIPSTIMNAVVKGKDVFRVRTGPYTTNSEANYWLKLIKVIDIAGLEESWIDQVVK